MFLQISCVLVNDARIGVARSRKQLGMAVDAEANPGGKTFGAFDKRGKARKWILIMDGWMDGY